MAVDAYVFSGGIDSLLGLSRIFFIGAQVIGDQMAFAKAEAFAHRIVHLQEHGELKHAEEHIPKDWPTTPSG